MSHRRSIVAFVLTLASLPALAAERTWPGLFGIGPCTGTLQACIDGAAPGDFILIGGDDLVFPDAYTLIDENIVITKSLAMKAKPGIDAVFAPERSILVDEVGGGALQVTLDSLTLRRGTIRFEHRAETLGADYLVRRVRVLDVPGPGSACGIAAFGTSATAANFRVLESTVNIGAQRTARASAICSALQASTTVAASNRIEAADNAMGSGISLGSASGLTTFRAIGNTILANGFRNGIVASQALNPPRYEILVAENVIAGQQSSDVESGAGINLSLGDARIRIVNNTVVDGRGGIALSYFPDTTVEGEVANNLVAFHRVYGISLSSNPSFTVTNRNNLIYGNASNLFTPGPGTVTADPQLFSLRDPHVSFVSPAFNAGVNAAVSIFSNYDADGEPRIVYGTVDIGAYEENDDRTRSQPARVDNTTLNYVTIDESEGVPYNGIDVLAATPQRGAGEAPATENVGVWLSDTSPYEWSIFHEDPFVPMPIGRRHSVMVVGNGRTGYIHDTTPASVTDRFSLLDHPLLNDNPGAVAIVTHAYVSGVTPAYHDFPIGLDFRSGRWYLRNEDMTLMPSARRFHFAISAGITPNNWQVENFAASSVSSLRLDHMLLDDNPCAAPLASRVDSLLPTVNNASPFALEYRAGVAGAAGHWYIAAQGAGASIPSGAEYNVMVDGSQANSCRNAELLPLFADSFE